MDLSEAKYKVVDISKRRQKLLFGWLKNWEIAKLSFQSCKGAMLKNKTYMSYDFIENFFQKAFVVICESYNKDNRQQILLDVLSFTQLGTPRTSCFITPFGQWQS